MMLTLDRPSRERTGGRTNAGYDDWFEGLMTDGESTPSARRETPKRAVPSRHIPTAKVNEIAEAFLNAIEEVIERVSLPELKLALYQAISESVRQRIGERPSTTESIVTVEIEPESEELTHSERRESPEITAAFLKVMKSMPVERGKRVRVYTDEELDQF